MSGKHARIPLTFTGRAVATYRYAEYFFKVACALSLISIKVENY